MCGRPGVTKEFNQTTSLIKTTLPELNAEIAVGRSAEFYIKKSGSEPSFILISDANLITSGGNSN